MSISKATHHGIVAFTRWFSSAGSVWQTTLAVLLWVGYEMTHPHADPHGFWLLYVLTIYSAITQPALAFASSMAAQSAERTEEGQILMLKNQEVTLTAVLALLTAMQEDGPPANRQQLETVLAFVDSLGPDFAAQMSALFARGASRHTGDSP